MKKLLSALLLTVSLTAPAIAENTLFYENLTNDKLWLIQGGSGDDVQNPACVAIANWEDGSRFELVKDLADGELYMYVRNVEWALTVGMSKVMLQFTIKGEAVNELHDLTVISPTEVVVRALDDTVFMPKFVSAESIIVLPKDSNGAGLISLTDGLEIATLMNDCLIASGEFTPPSEPTTAPVKKPDVVA